MFVGHLPFMSKLASLLVTGGISAEIISFVQGGFACLDKNDETDKFQLLYIIRPDIL